MGTGYQRADVGNQISNGSVIDADVLDLEFDAVEAAFNSSTGHTHDGTTAEGGPITVTGPTQDFVHNASWLEPKVTNTIDIGSTSKRFKQGWFQGIVTSAGGFIGNLTGAVTGNVTGNVTGTLTGNVTGNVTGDVTGNANTATTLQTPRTINGTIFDGSTNISVNMNHSLTSGVGLVSTGAFNGGAAVTFSLGTPSTISGETTNSVSGTTHTHLISHTSSRSTDSTSILLDAKGMFDHVASGDHDSRYPRLASANTFEAVQTVSGNFPGWRFTNPSLPVNSRSSQLGMWSDTFRFLTLNDDFSIKAIYATIEAPADGLPLNTSLVTREKGDDRYAPINGEIPIGGIIMWSGSVASIPANWALCNGSSGTPDLRNRFVVGAGATYSVGATGGAATVTLTEAQIPAHTHSVSGVTDVQGAHTHLVEGASAVDSGPFNRVTTRADRAGSFDQATTSAGAHGHSVTGTAASTGGGAAHENMPPYYALAYIMRVS